MESSALLGFAAVALALIVVPGPDWAHVLAAGARDRIVAPAVSGIAIGYVIVTAVLVAGLGPLVTGLPGALATLTVVGGGYLVWVGIRTLRTARHAAIGAEQVAIPAMSGRSHLRRGIGVSALNPKSLLLFLAILPQFAHASIPWPLPVQLGALGGVYVLISILFLASLGLAAERVLGARPGVARATSTVAGVAMVLAGVALLIERVLTVLT